MLRNDNLDEERCKPEFVSAMFEDLSWFGFRWDEGPDVGGSFGPYNQSARFGLYRAALERLRAGKFVYPCACSRKDIQAAVTAPHAEDEELIYPGTCREQSESKPGAVKCSWRFRVPDRQTISFTDENLGEQKFAAGTDFGDFVVWRHDGVPAYQLACVVDDAAMRISEVVRGADLRVSTARQILLYRALGLATPRFFHCELLCDESGRRLAKRHDSQRLSHLRERGFSPANLRADWCF